MSAENPEIGDLFYSFDLEATYLVIGKGNHLLRIQERLCYSSTWTTEDCTRICLKYIGSIQDPLVKLNEYLIEAAEAGNL